MPRVSCQAAAGTGAGHCRLGTQWSPPIEARATGWREQGQGALLPFGAQHLKQRNRTSNQGSIQEELLREAKIPQLYCSFR